MAKDPAFLFYPNDWIGGTMGMTFEEKGAYIELLMMQFNRGHMTKHMIGQTVGQLWDKISDKFEMDKEGKYFNKRLEEEKIKRVAYTKSRFNNKSGKNQWSKKGGHMTNHMTAHMEDEDVDINIIDNYIAEISKSEIYLEGFYMKYKLEKGSAFKLLDTFKQHLKMDGKIHASFSEFKKHFNNWMNTQESNKQLEPYKRQKKGAL